MAQALAHAEPEAGRPEVVLASAVRNEGPFILEWVAYHRAIGVDRVVLISNGSTDGTDELLDALADAGEIHHYRATPTKRQSPQMAAVQVFEKKHGYQDGDWYIWLDADEFLNIHVGSGKLPDLVLAIGDHLGLCINWRIFGTSGHERFPGRFVSGHFQGTSSLRLGANREIKTIFRKIPDIIGFAQNAVYRPRLVAGHRVSETNFLGGNGRPLFPDVEVNRKWLAGDQAIRTNILSPRETGWAFAQINHYSVRTPEFFKLKALRGRGAAKLRLNNNSRHTEEYFQRYDINGEKDISIARWETDVSAEMQRLLSIPGVAAAKARVDRLVAGVLAELDNITRLQPDGGDPVPTAENLQAEAAEPDAKAPDFALTFALKERQFLTRHYETAETILEYGSGGSTVLGAQLGRRVFSVESDKAWADRLAAYIDPISPNVHVHYADIGPTGAWGVPTRAREYRKFPGYALSVWDRPDFVQPDLVLIDGRFRASCLVAVMLRTTRPVTVLFDDYRKRSYYHGVEKLARKEEVIGRMARFTVTPGAIPAEMLTQAIGWFTDPR